MWYGTERPKAIAAILEACATGPEARAHHAALFTATDLEGGVHQLLRQWRQEQADEFGPVEWEYVPLGPGFLRLDDGMPWPDAAELAATFDTPASPKFRAIGRHRAEPEGIAAKLWCTLRSVVQGMR